MNFRDITDKHGVASAIAQKWHEWNGARSGKLKIWAEIDKYIHATDTTDLEGGNNFTHTVMIPVVSEIHEDLLAIMYATVFPHNDWLGWKPFDREASTVAKRDKILNYLKHIHTLNGFPTTGRQVIDDLVRYGNCFGEVVPADERVLKEDGTVGAGYVGAKPRRISPYDIVFNPAAPDFKNTDKIVRTVVHVGELREYLEALPTGYNKEALESLLRSRSADATSDIAATNKNAQYVPQGFNSYEEYIMSGYVEVLTFYGNTYDESTFDFCRNKQIMVVDGSKVLVEREISGSRIFKGSWKKVPDNLWSQGALDNVIGINYMANHRENSKNEAIDRFIHPDRLYVGDVEEIYDEVTGQIKYLAPEGGNVVDMRPDTTILSYNNEISIHLEMARRAARLPQQLSGFRSAGEKTAFEVQSLNDGAFRGFINKAEQFEQEFLEPLVTAEIEIARENFQSVVQVSKKDPDGLTMFLEVTEDDLKSNGVLVPYGARRFSRLLQQQAGLTQLSNSALGQQVAAHMNTYALSQAVESVYGFEDFELFEKFAAVTEGLEAQQMQALAENEFVSQQSQPSMQEMEMDAEEQAILEGLE